MGPGTIRPGRRAEGPRERHYESSSVGQKDLRQVQGDPPRRRGAGHLRQPETQTEAGITGEEYGTYCRCGSAAKKRAEIGLTYIYGIGRTRAKSLLYRAGIDFDKKVAT
jgi:hypothetical protein